MTVADDPPTTTGDWICLFSGGKDSTWALYRALSVGIHVDRLLTVHPPSDSYLYHVPAISLTRLASESIGIPLEEVDATTIEGTDGDSTSRGAMELEPLDRAIGQLVGTIDLTGIVVGAVESEYQYDLIREVSRKYALDIYAPLWKRDPVQLATEMIDAGFVILIIQVAAEGLDASWIGRRYDRDALDALRSLHRKYGVHILGEGGEFETLVIDGPHMHRPIVVEGRKEWEGSRGRFLISEARLG